MNECDHARSTPILHLSKKLSVENICRELNIPVYLDINEAEPPILAYGKLVLAMLSRRTPPQKLNEVALREEEYPELPPNSYKAMYH